MKQTTLNEQIEKATGQPVPANTVHIPVPPPTRARTKDGFVSKFIHIPEQHWAKVTAYIDAHDLDEGKFLTTLMKRGIDGLE